MEQNLLVEQGNYARQFWSLIKTKFTKNLQQNEVIGTSVHLLYHGWTWFWKLLFVKRPSMKYLCSKRKRRGQCKSLHLLFLRHNLKEGAKVCCSRFFIYWGNVSHIFNWDWMSHQYKVTHTDQWQRELYRRFNT